MNQQPNTVEALHAAQAVHDQVAINLMRQAQRHLRESTALGRQIEQLERVAESDQQRGQQ